MAIIANDFTLGYFNFSLGLPTSVPPTVAQTEASSSVPTVSAIDDMFMNEIKNEIINTEWTTNDTNATWD